MGFLWERDMQDKMYSLSLMNNNISASSYVGVLDDKWHFRFGHVNKKTLDRMMKYDLIPKNNKSPL